MPQGGEGGDDWVYSSGGLESEISLLEVVRGCWRCT